MRKKTVLVVDDIHLIRNILSSFVKAEDCICIEASSGSQALRIIEEQPVDLVFLDLMMPGIDGIAVLEKVRKKKSPEELPIVIASALDEEGNVEGALSRGANDYIIKPFTRAIIREKLERFLFSKEARDFSGGLLRDDPPGAGGVERSPSSSRRPVP